ncbi:DUF4228 domain-containing protein [Cephalotus follicularis]|uniref:DUF4228 domain-containing protein n=1 Tax=Cephalotus follicularis TaxID=3775 RepID=A0A1Q3BST3_CEPFO|nr:DUF4228 domain-containing protein [Cephalotus follicularis]
MGNCQAIDAATLVIQHPSGKADKFYWPLIASEVMRNNPGHYVALLISTTLCTPNSNAKCPDDTTLDNNNNNSSVRLTRIKLLRPTDTLVVGQVYRLITTQEVMEGLQAKKCAKMTKKAEKQERVVKEQSSRVETSVARRSEIEKQANQVIKQQERHQPRTATNSTNSATSKSRTWQPSLKSISEGGC